MTTHSSFYGLLCFSTGDMLTGKEYIRPELHLNIWEKGESVHLDIGLMLDLDDPSATVELYFPWPLVGTEGNSPEDIEDLAKRITAQDAIPAVFNESWSVTIPAKNSGYLITEPNTNALLFTIVDVGGAVSAKKHQDTAHALSINVKKLKEKAISLSPQTPKLYVRFRVRSVPKSFYCVGIDQKDSGWVSSWQRTEIIDFRLNVRRGVPSNLERSIGPFIEFSKVHLFLMKSRNQDIVFEDTLFKSCRSLEDEEFWAGYASNGTDADKRKSLLNVKQSIGYQWSKKANRDGGLFVKEFGILARFKKVEFGIGKFLIFALILGALGNALWDGVKLGYDKIYPTSNLACQSECNSTVNPSRSEGAASDEQKGVKK